MLIWLGPATVRACAAIADGSLAAVPTALRFSEGPCLVMIYSLRPYIRRCRPRPGYLGRLSSGKQSGGNRAPHGSAPGDLRY